jgi:hypothetical protein
MKGFAIFILVLCVIGALIGFMMMTIGNNLEATQGAGLLGSGITGILLSCVVIALADIRKALTPPKDKVPAKMND